MRSANEILMKNIGIIPINMLPIGQLSSILEAINEARKEAIEECAEIVEEDKWLWENRESILSLINELK